MSNYVNATYEYEFDEDGHMFFARRAPTIAQWAAIHGRSTEQFIEDMLRCVDQVKGESDGALPHSTSGLRKFIL